MLSTLEKFFKIENMFKNVKKKQKKGPLLNAANFFNF